MARGPKKRARRDEPPRDTRDREALEIERLRDENERLRKQLEEQAKRIADLERQLALKQQNSTITSKPPSSDGLAGHQRVRGRRVKSRRRPGGQPAIPDTIGHLVPWSGSTRSWISRRPRATGVRHRLHVRHTVGDPRRHQVTELPAIAAHITEYRCVQWRKIMFGTRSAQGERAVERLLTIVRTCQLQHLSALAYLTAAIVAHRRCQPVASLLKQRHTT